MKFSKAAIPVFKNFKLPARYLTLFPASVGPLMEHKFMRMGIRHRPGTAVDEWQLWSFEMLGRLFRYHPSVVMELYEANY